MASVNGIHHTTDPRNAEDRIPLTDPQDWNARIHVVNGSPHAKPYPVDRIFWAVTDEGEAVEVSYCDQTKYWTGEEVWGRVDGESGSWSADELVGWSDSQEDAEEAAALFLKVA